MPGARLRLVESPGGGGRTLRPRRPAAVALAVWSAAAFAVYFGIYFWNAGVYWLKVPSLLSGLFRRLGG